MPLHSNLHLEKFDSPKSVGVVADAPISCSTVLASEPGGPLLEIADSEIPIGLGEGNRVLKEKFSALSEEKREILLGLSGAKSSSSLIPAEDSNRAVEIFWNNSQPGRAEESAAVFEILSRFNHSCNPNAMFRYRRKKRQQCCSSTGNDLSSSSQ